MENDSTKEIDIIERIRFKNISIRKKKLIENYMDPLSLVKDIINFRED